MPVLCRCNEHPPANDKEHIYTYFAEPVGYPNTSSICGRVNCPNVGYIFMTNDEVVAFSNGKRVYKYANGGTKVKVNDTIPIATNNL